MRTVTMTLLTLLFVLPGLALGQVYGDRMDREETPVELELGVAFSSVDYDMADLHEALDARAAALGSATDVTVTRKEKVEPQIMFPLRLGLRIRNLHVGFRYVDRLRQDAGIDYTVNTDTRLYSIRFRARDFGLYAGYLQPLNHWLTVGGMAGVAFGNVNGTYTFDADNVTAADLAGTYYPWRVSALARVRITSLISAEVAGGWNSATTSTLEADTDAGMVPLRKPGGEEIELSWTGAFFQVGLVFTNPLDL